MGQAVLLHLVAQLVPALQDGLSLPGVRVGLVPHSTQASQNQAVLLVQLVLGVLGAPCAQAVQAGPSPSLPWVLVILVVLADPCDLVLLLPPAGLAVPAPLVYLFLAAPVVLGDPEVLAVQMAPPRPLDPFLLVVPLRHLLLACLEVLENLVSPLQGVLVDQEVQVVLRVLAVHSLEVLQVLEVQQVQVVQLGLARLEASLQHHWGWSDL